MSMSSNQSSSPSPRPANPLGSFVYMGLGFLAIFLVTFLVVLAFIPLNLQKAHEELNRDLPATVREYSNTATRVPVVGTRSQRPEENLEPSVDQ